MTEAKGMSSMEALLSRIEDHERIGAEIDKEMAALNVTPRDIRKIKTAREAAKRAQETLAALMAGGMVPGK